LDAYSRDEILALLRAARQVDERDWLMILVTFLHGLRVSETLGLKRDSVQGDILIVGRLKGSIRTKQPLLNHPDPLLSERQAMFELARKSNRNQKLFPMSRKTFWRRMQEYAAAAGLPKAKAHPHALKHSIAMQLIDSAGIHRTQAWLGHKSMSSTGAYLKPANEDVFAAARKALGAL